MKNRLSTYLWGEKAKLRYIGVVGFLLVFFMLGAHTIWTQENRWANIVSNMLYTGDYLHPYLKQQNYYDKPLLSYWFIVGFVKLTGCLNTFILRLPSAIVGYASIFALFSLANSLFSRRVGFIAAWMYLTCFGFIFWTRIASADMLNVAGILIAVWWYNQCKDCPTFWRCLLFFIVVAAAALCKGLVAVVCIALFILPDWIRNKRWTIDLNLKMLLSLTAALAIYFLPYWLSAHFNEGDYRESGLQLVYQENIVRYFNAFDHKGPLSTYFIALPYYLLPWFLFFIPALAIDIKYWAKITWSSKWLWLGILINFVFFCSSESRRNYYILPLIPFVILVLSARIEQWLTSKTREKILAYIIATCLVFYALINWIVMPIAYSGGGDVLFANEVREQATKHLPWSDWNIVVLDAKMQHVFYLNAPSRPYYADQDVPHDKNKLEIYRKVIDKNNSCTLYIADMNTYEALHNKFTEYTAITLHAPLYERLIGTNKHKVVALVPNNTTELACKNIDN